MKSQEPHDRDRMERADPKALATARELALLIPNDAMMLFGSRARGDHRPDSDIDILLLSDTAQEGVHQTAYPGSRGTGRSQGLWRAPTPRGTGGTHAPRHLSAPSTAEISWQVTLPPTWYWQKETPRGGSEIPETSAPNPSSPRETQWKH